MIIATAHSHVISENRTVSAPPSTGSIEGISVRQVSLLLNDMPRWLLCCDKLLFARDTKYFLEFVCCAKVLWNNLVRTMVNTGHCLTRKNTLTKQVSNQPEHYKQFMTEQILLRGTESKAERHPKEFF